MCQDRQQLGPLRSGGARIVCRCQYFLAGWQAEERLSASHARRQLRSISCANPRGLTSSRHNGHACAGARETVSGTGKPEVHAFSKWIAPTESKGSATMSANPSWKPACCCGGRIRIALAQPFNKCVRGLMRYDSWDRQVFRPLAVFAGENIQRTGRVHCRSRRRSHRKTHAGRPAAGGRKTPAQPPANASPDFHAFMCFASSLRPWAL